MNKAILLLGSNIDPEVNIVSALIKLRNRLKVIKTSSIYKSEPVGREDDPYYLNLAVLVETNTDPVTLKYEYLRKIESSLGRKRTEDKYAPRTIDIDIILWNEEIIKNNEICVPDPDLEKYAHCLLPISEIVPEYVHPELKISLKELAEKLENTDYVIKLE